MNQQKAGKFLKYLRKGKGLTQEQPAEHFYVSPRTVSRWEKQYAGCGYSHWACRFL